MPDLKILLYRDNRTPRAIELSTRTLYRTLILILLLTAFLVVSVGVATKLLVGRGAKTSEQLLPSHDENESIGPTNSLEEQNRALKDQVELLQTKVSNAAAVAQAPRDIDKNNPALALFTPNVVDKTQGQSGVVIQNFKYSPMSGKSPATLTFELHNANPGSSVQKGYIVVVGRRDNELHGYPTVFNKSGPYLLDFEKGETFQVARFRLVNASFGSEAKDLDTFQVFIFTRTGELLINRVVEVKNAAR